MIKLQLLQLLELACYSGLYVIRAPLCISIGHLLRRRSSSRKVLKMHRGLARALFSIKQNVASLDATFYYAPCRYHVVDKLQSAFRSTSSSPFFLFYFFFPSPETFLWMREVSNNGGLYSDESRLLALFVPNSIGTLKRALTKQNRI